MVAAAQASSPPEFLRLASHPLRWALMSALAGSDLRVRELVARAEEPQNLVSYHLRLLRDGGLVTVSRSSFDGRDSYYHLDLDRCADGLAGVGATLHPALHPALRPALRPGAAAPALPAGRRRSRRPSVLFVCTGNSARSPIAEVLLRQRLGGRVTVTSAGTRPKPELHPHAVRVLDELFGIDVADQRPRHLDTFARRRFDHVVTLCDKAREACPPFRDQPRRIHWSVPDPATAPGDEQHTFEETARDIDTRVRYLLPVLAHRSEEAQP